MGIPKRRVRLRAFGLAKMALAILTTSIAIAAVLIEAFPLDPYEQAVAHLQQGDHASAERVLVDRVRTQPDDVDAWRTLVDVSGYMRAITVQLQGEGVPVDVTRFDPSLTDAALFDLIHTCEPISPLALAARFAVARGHEVTDALDIIFRDPPKLSDVKEAMKILVENGGFEDVVTLSQLFDDDTLDADVVEIALDAMVMLRLDDLFLERMADPAWYALSSSMLRIDHALIVDDHPLVARLLLNDVHAHVVPAVFVAAALAGLTWVLFLLVTGAVWEWRRRDQLALAAALAAGVLSAVATLVFATIMDDVIEHASRVQSDPYLFAYSVMGIGFREEFLKILFVAPILFLAKNARHDGEFLLIASMAGLGFAIEENVSYFSGAETSPVVIGRFLTANFLHLALTGVTGLSLGRAFKHGGAHWETFTMDLVRAVVAHGLYDFLLMTNAMDGLAYFAMTVFVWLAKRYLDHLLPLFPLQSRPVALSTAFTACLASAIGINYALVAMFAGLTLAFEITFLGVIGNVLVAFVFFRGLQEEIQ